MSRACTCGPPLPTGTAETASARCATQSQRATSRQPPISSGSSRAEYVTHGRSATVTNWCALLSPEDLAAHPAAALARGWAAFEAGDAEDAEHCATLALAGDPQRILPDGATLQPLGLLLRGATGLRGRSKVVEDMERADAGLPAEHPLRAVSLYVLGSLAMLDDDRERARTLLEHAEQRAAGQLPTVYGLILAQQALLAIDVDHWEQAETFSSRAAAQQRAAGTRDYATQGLVPAVRALTLARRGARDQARDEADQAVRNMALQRVLLPWLALETRLVLACAYAKLGDGGRARSLVRECEGLDVRDLGPLLGRWLTRVETEIEAAGEGPAAPTSRPRSCARCSTCRRTCRCARSANACTSRATPSRPTRSRSIASSA